MKIRVQSITAPGFFRLGTFWPLEGKEVAQADFSETQWEVLSAEPNLRVSAVKEEVSVDTAGLREQVFAAIGALPPEGFGADGAPLLTALHGALPDLICQITPQLRDALWAEAKALPASDAAEGAPVEEIPADAVAAPEPAAPEAVEASDPAPDLIADQTADLSPEELLAEALPEEELPSDMAGDPAPETSFSALILAAFAALGAEDFLADGRPKVAAIQALLPADAPVVTAEIRDALWAEYLAAQTAL